MDNMIAKITEDAKKRGHDVRIRDIAYATLRVVLKDELIAYTVVFGAPNVDSDITAYDGLESTKYLVRWFEKELKPKSEKKDSDSDLIKKLSDKKSEQSDDGSITFEENRAGMEQLLLEIAAAKTSDLPPRELVPLLKAEADVRSKLNDKFGAAEKQNEQYIIVQPKYNTICPHTQRECWTQTKEFAMKHWHLIDDPNYNK